MDTRVKPAYDNRSRNLLPFTISSIR